LCFRVEEIRFRVEEIRFRVEEIRFRVEEIRFRVEEIRFRVEEIRFRVEEIRFRSNFHSGKCTGFVFCCYSVITVDAQSYMLDVYTVMGNLIGY